MMHEYIAYRVDDGGFFAPVEHDGEVRTIKLREGDTEIQILYAMRANNLILWDGKRKPKGRNKSRGRRKNNKHDYTQLRGFKIDRFSKVGDDGIEIRTQQRFTNVWMPSIYLIKSDLDPSYTPAWLKES